MNSHEFVNKWSGVELKERSFYQEHFLDICRLVGHQTPNDLVKKKYFDEFVNKKDVHFFLGTALEFHRRRTKNPFMIIGVFYTPKTNQPKLI